MFRVVPPSIIRSAYNCIYSIWYLSHRYCYLPLSWKSWNWFECAVGGARQYSNIYPTRCNVTQFFIYGDCSTCFGWYLHPSSGAHTTVPTASAICQTATATCRYSWMYSTIRHPQHAETSSNSSTIAADSSNGVTNTRCCRYSCMRP